MITWIHKEDKFWEGTFHCSSRYFHDEDGQSELIIGIENGSLADYAEKCVESLNTLPDETVLELCKGIIKCAAQGGLNEEFALPQLDNPLDILQYCWFTTVYTNKPNQDGVVSYVVEGEGDWGEVVGFVIENGRLAYVGVDYFDYMNGAESITF